MVTEKDLKASFPLFLLYIWRHLQLPDPTDCQNEIAEYLQYGPARKMIQAFRGIGKSWISAAYCVWRLWNDPQRKILVVSATGSKAKDFSLFCQRLIEEVPILQDMRPRASQKTHRWSVLSFDVSEAKVSQSPSMKAVGITGQITGSRATDIVFDDVEVPDNSLTIDARDKLLTKCTVEGESVLVPDIPTTITYLGTPQTEDSLYKKIDERGYKLRIWPARVPTQKAAEAYGGKLAQSIEDMVWDPEVEPGTVTDPKRFSDEILTEREMSMGRSGFQLQFMLDTTLSDAERYPLKLSDLTVLEANLEDRGPVSITWGSGRPQVINDIKQIGFSGDRWHRPMALGDSDWAPWDGVIMAIDPSGRGRDETSYAVVAILHGRLFLLASGGFRGGYTTATLEELCKVARTYKATYVITESNFGGGMFTQLLLPILERIHPGCGIEEVRHNTQKERRIIDTLEPVLNGHKLVVPVSVIQNDLKLVRSDQSTHYSLFYQMTRLTKERGCLRQDDRLDALSMAVAYWVDQMSRDATIAERDYKKEQLEKSLEKHIEAALGQGQFRKQIGPTSDIYGVDPVGAPSAGTLGNFLSNF